MSAESGTEMMDTRSGVSLCSSTFNAEITENIQGGSRAEEKRRLSADQEWRLFGLEDCMQVQVGRDQMV